MPEIPDISNNDISIRSIQIKDVNNWILSPSQSIPPVVPVTQVIGLPIVNIPGCVEATETNSSKNNPLRKGQG